MSESSKERLQKYLARAGVASRRAAEVLITDGRVQVNNQRVTELGTRVEPDRDVVTVDGKPVMVTEKLLYLILYKPPGVVTTLSDPQGRTTVKDLMARVDGRVYPVGRLDYDAEGALIVTSDGELANRLTHPRFQVERTYLAKVKGEPQVEALERLRSGVRLEDGDARPKALAVFEQAERNTWLKLTVTEGRPHLIKRMCAAIGHPVVRLFRPSHAGIGLEGLRPGQFRSLTTAEVERVWGVARGEVAPVVTLRLPARRHGRAEAHEEGEDEAPRRWNDPRGAPGRTTGVNVRTPARTNREETGGEAGRGAKTSERATGAKARTGGKPERSERSPARVSGRFERSPAPRSGGIKPERTAPRGVGGAARSSGRFERSMGGLGRSDRSPAPGAEVAGRGDRGAPRKGPGRGPPRASEGASGRKGPPGKHRPSGPPPSGKRPPSKSRPYGARRR